MKATKIMKSAGSLTNWILGITTVQLAVGIVIHTAWLVTGNGAWLRYYFDYLGAFLFLTFSFLEVFLAYAVYRQFSSDQPLGSAWLFITLAAGCHLLGTILKSLLGVNSYLNPLHYLMGIWNPATAEVLRGWGAVVGGPVQMALLAYGLFLSLRLYKESGLLGKLRASDWALVGSGTIYTSLVLYQIVTAIIHRTSPLTLHSMLTWPNDLLLDVLLFEAIFLRRSAVDMGWGFVSKVWTAFAVAIFLTTVGNVCNWMIAYGYLPWLQSAFVWYLWYPAEAAFVLGPAFQVEASKTAQARLEEWQEEHDFVCA